MLPLVRKRCLVEEVHVLLLLLLVNLPKHAAMLDLRRRLPGLERFLEARRELRPQDRTRHAVWAVESYDFLEDGGRKRYRVDSTEIHN